MPDGLEHKRVHFIGIGGVGMSALAQILISDGTQVSGSDPMENEATERLKAAGATIYREQTAENIQDARPDLVVVTAAVHEDNPELVAARKAGIPVVSRAEFLGQVMAEKGGPRIAIAGTHGKTTTTSMMAAVLLEAGLDPTVLVGGEFGPMGGNVRVGGDVILAEACEAYDSFLSLAPDIAIITNVESDHLDYYGTEDRVRESFRRFVERIPDSGAVIWCADDEGAKAVVESAAVNGLRIGYGLSRSEGVSLFADSIEPAGGGHEFVVHTTSGALGRIKLGVPGRHNVLNALAVTAASLELGIEFETIALALEEFRGAGRRFEIRGEIDGALVVDDYAHHPTEVRATLEGARAAYPDRRIVALFQPHLYSRTRDFLNEFAQALIEADAVLVTDIYAAREKPIPGIRASDLVRVIANLDYDKTVMYVPKMTDAVAALRWIAQPGDLILTMGAGDVDQATELFLSVRRVA